MNWTLQELTELKNWLIAKIETLEKGVQKGVKQPKGFFDELKSKRCSLRVVKEEIQKLETSLEKTI